MYDKEVKTNESNQNRVPAVDSVEDIPAIID